MIKVPMKIYFPRLLKYKNENKDKQIIVLENEQNSGFVKTVIK